MFPPGAPAAVRPCGAPRPRGAHGRHGRGAGEGRPDRHGEEAAGRGGSGHGQGGKKSTFSLLIMEIMSWKMFDDEGVVSMITSITAMARGSRCTPP